MSPDLSRDDWERLLAGLSAPVETVAERFSEARDMETRDAYDLVEAAIATDDRVDVEGEADLATVRLEEGDTSADEVAAEHRQQIHRDPPDTRDLAERLGVRDDLLVGFVDRHPEPTAPIVLGWASVAGRPGAEPDDLRADVVAWLDERDGGLGK